MLQAHFLGHMEIEDMSTRFSRDIETMKKKLVKTLKINKLLI